MAQVSIVVPNYNHARFLRARLESIAHQEFQDYELILLDDASTDDSLQILQEFAALHNTEVIENEQNSGSPFVQWDKGLAHAAGEYIWIAESDDIAAPTLLSHLVAVLDSDQEIGLVECGATRIDSEGNVLGSVIREALPEHRHLWDNDFLAEGTQFVREFLYFDNSIPSASGVLFRRQLYLDTGPAAVELEIAGDWWKWASILLKSKYAFVAETLNQSRIHEQTRRFETSSDGRRETEALVVQCKIGKETKIDTRLRRQGCSRYALSFKQSLRAGRWCGSWRLQAKFLSLLMSLDLLTAISYAITWPVSLGLWLLRRHLSDGNR